MSSSLYSFNYFQLRNSNPELRPKKELIEQFIDQIDDTADTHEAWVQFRDEQKAKELAQIVSDENLKMSETENLIKKVFRIGQFEITDAELSEILPPMPRFGGGMEARLQKKERVCEMLNNFFLKYYD